MAGRHVIWAMAAAYALPTFAAGALMGAVRVLLVTPLTGPVGAVLLELPMMLAVAWFICGLILGAPWASRRFADRLAMGVAAFTLLMSLEMLLGLLVFGQAPGEIFRGLSAPAGRLGLLGQAAFALLPLVPRPAPAPPKRASTSETFPAAWPRADA
ncbi:hypothetical protein [Phenylobacterium conjunctum]|jgi:hypothetical protein|uniref:Uncharacterized protein n=1 Tax=Phenylobacterium conjunctum TaxID=1298959 RepID=A0ABW3T086_9CAUL